MTIDYRTLMTSKEIPWHNPHGLVPEQVDPENEGWRLALKEEICDNSPLRGKCFVRASGYWDGGFWDGNGQGETYRTREPLPEKYRHLVEPDYSDPAYRASVEEAFRNGAATEFKGRKGTEWSFVIAPSFVWDACDYRIAPNQPAKDPAPDSDAHKLAEVIAAADAGRACEYWNEGHGKWIPERTVADVARSIIYGRKVRIKPTPVKVPLSDYRVSEAIRIYGKTYVIERVNGLFVFCDRGNFHALYLMEGNAQIHRNGKWCDCFTFEEGGK